MFADIWLRNNIVYIIWRKFGNLTFQFELVFIVDEMKFVCLAAVILHMVSIQFFHYFSKKSGIRDLFDWDAPR